MKGKFFIYAGFAAAAACPLTGCGSTTTATASFGSPNVPGATPPDTRLDFLVDNNQVGSAGATTTPTAPVDTSNLQNIQKLKSFILVQVEGTANPSFHFQFTDYMGSPGSPAFNKNNHNYLSLNNPPFIYFDTANLLNAKPPATVLHTPLGDFDPGVYTYTPPAQVVVDTIHHTAAERVALDSFGLVAIPNDPALTSQASAFFIHLNLLVSINPTAASLTVNTPDAPALYQQQFVASVPGDGVRSAYVPAAGQAAAQGEGQVDWSFTQQDGKTASSTGSIDKTTGLFIAPTQPGTYIIKATSRTQPDKFATVPIVVNQATTTITFKSARR